MDSIGICAYNEGKSIAKAIKALQPQLGAKDELIVVASGCTDRTEEKVRELSEKDPRIKLLVQERREGKASATNLLFRQAKGKVVFLTDADVIVENGALAALKKCLGGKGVGAAIAQTKSIKKENVYDKMQDFAWKTFNELREKQSREGELFALNGYLSAVENGLVKELPLDSLVEDWMIGWKIKRKARQIVYCPLAVVKVKAPQNLGDWLNQKKRVRAGQLQLKAKGMSTEYVRQAGNLGKLLENFYAWPYLALDLLAWGLAWIELKTGKIAWKPINSSKI